MSKSIRLHVLVHLLHVSQLGQILTNDIYFEQIERHKLSADWIVNNNKSLRSVQKIF